MEEASYTKRELDHYFQDMRSNIKEILTDGKETKVQVYKTNGRVTKHDWYFRALWWALGICGTILVLIVPSIIKFINHITILDQKVTDLNNNYSITP